jgi:phage terminase small subunit
MPPLRLQKQERFCLEYFKCGNASEAARIAKYSPKTAGVIGRENLLKPNIQARLAELRAKAENESIASVIERKQILTEILRTKLTDFMELGKDGSWVNIGPETPNSRAISEVHSRTEYDENGDKPTIYTSVKLHDPIRAAQELNKMDGIYKEGNQVSVNLDQRQLIIQVVDQETQDLLNRVQNGEQPKLETHNDIQGQPQSIS